ncbi:ATP-binding protein, partial [Candidatus Bathyarchaeota archaeon]|nr:ATP-binding protein [Candidatus Bathyarchaeota archaeon]
VNGKRPILVGETKENSALMIDATSLDGKLNIITGKKGTGKSHLSKLLITSLLQYGATVVVLDLNGEYAGLGITSDGKRNAYYDKVHVLTPGENFKVALSQLHLNELMSILIHALHLPGTSAREFRRIWQTLKQRGCLTLHDLGEAIRNWHCNQNVKDALFSRYYAMLNSGFFTDNMAEASRLEEALLKSRRDGGAVIINLKNTSTIDRQIVVEYLLGKLVEMLTSWRLKAVFLFAEEAHLYLRETYWDDIVTRMRHFGIFTTFITNQPDSIRESIYRQADNIFLFNFTNESDLEVVSRAARVDSETVKSIARELPPRHCLVLGKAVEDFPIVVKVRTLDVKTMGET